MELTDQAFRKFDPRGRAFEATYAGATSFLRRPYRRDLAGIDIAVTGIPFDSAVTYRPGCRLGPRALRAASVQLSELPAFPWNFDPFEHLAVVDYGDAALNPHEPLSVPDAITAHIAEIVAQDVMPLSLGGDHFITYPILKAIAAKHGPVALLQFDAHCDTWPTSSGVLDHGTMFLKAKQDGLIDVSRSAQVGLRTANEDGDHGFEILNAPWVHRNGIDATLERIKARVGSGPVYMTFDIDFFDPATAPGTGTPVPGGFQSWQGLELIRGLGDLNFVGMDLVEVSPPFDHAEITALAGAHIAHDWLAVLADRKRKSTTCPQR